MQHPFYAWSLADLFEWLVHLPILAIVGAVVLVAVVISGLRSLG